MFFLSATVFKVSDKIKLINEIEATDVDKVLAKILKLSHGASLHLLTDVINVSRRTESFQELL